MARRGLSPASDQSSVSSMCPASAEYASFFSENYDDWTPAA